MSAKSVRRPALKARQDPPSALQTSFNEAAAMVWLLDQVRYGNLSFLRKVKPESPASNAWAAAKVVTGMSSEDLLMWIEGAAFDTMTKALGEVRRELAKLGIVAGS